MSAKKTANVHQPLSSYNLCIFCATRLYFPPIPPLSQSLAPGRLLQSSSKVRRPGEAVAAIEEDRDGAQHFDPIAGRRPSTVASQAVIPQRMQWNVPHEQHMFSTKNTGTKWQIRSNGRKRIVPRAHENVRATGVSDSNHSIHVSSRGLFQSSETLQPSDFEASTENTDFRPALSEVSVNNPLNARGGWTSDASVGLTPEEEKLRQELSKQSLKQSRLLLKQDVLNTSQSAYRERVWPGNGRERRWEASNRSLEELLRKSETKNLGNTEDSTPERHGKYECRDCGRWNNHERNKVCFNCQARPDSDVQAYANLRSPGVDNLVPKRFGMWDCHCGTTNYSTRKACHSCGKHRDSSQTSSQIGSTEDDVLSKDVLLGVRNDGIETTWQWKHLKRRANTENNAEMQVPLESQKITGDVEPDLESCRFTQERAERLQKSQDGNFIGFTPAQDSITRAEQEHTRPNSDSSQQARSTKWKSIVSASDGSRSLQQQKWSDRIGTANNYSPERTARYESRVRRDSPDLRAPKLEEYEAGKEAQPMARSYRGLENGSDRNRAKDRQRAQRNTRKSYDEDEDMDQATVSRIERKRQRKKEKLADKSTSSPTPIILPEYISIGNLASALRVRVEDLSSKMRSLGFEETNNDHVLDAETAGLIGSEFNFEPIVSRKENTVEDLIALPPAEDKTFLLQRPPVITIMGHVDHGKTTLLDWLRKSSVAASEHGGITQHIGAFTVPMPSGRIITFLDTPGHAAFLKMRQRGANVTDIVILVVAADDSVKPQTIEAIKHAQAAKVPMIVAINKIDKPDSDIERVKQDLARHGVEIEDFGGETQVVRVSGKTGQGMEELEDSAVALADILDLRAETDGQAEGWVLEAFTGKAGRVATVLVRRGIVVPGSVLVAGSTWARVRSLRNEAGVSVPSAGPGTPVEIDGWREQPEAGDEVLQAPDEQRAKAVVELRLAQAEKEKMATDVIAVNEARRFEQEKREREEATSADPASNIEDKVEPQQPSGAVEIPFIIRGDVSGSVEAVVNSVSSLGNSEVRPTILRSAVGPIAPTDVEHAAAAKGHIISFSTPVESSIRRMAEAAGVSILDQNIIYRLTDDVKAKLEEALPALLMTRVVGEADVAEVFNINVKGRITVPVAGCRVRNGVISRGTKIRILRDGVLVYNGTLFPHFSTLLCFQVATTIPS